MSISERKPVDAVDWSQPSARPIRREVSIAEMAPDQCGEVAALFAGDFEFATTTGPRTAEQIRAACAAGELECLVVQLAEEGRSLGLVGAMLFSAGGAALRLDAFALAAPARGWVVEEQMLALLGAIARLRSLPRVEVVFTPSATNLPALEFFRALAGRTALNAAAPTPIDGAPEDSAAPLRFQFAAERLTRLAARRAPATLGRTDRPHQPR